MGNNNTGIDHDRLFKELLETFFEEFMELFFPEIHQQIDFNDLHFNKQEIFTDVTVGEKHFIDLLAETKLKGEEGIILVHVESQAQYQANFAERMFIYFSRLYQKYRSRIFPIAIFSYDQIKDEPDNFNIKFPFLYVLDFNFHIVELKKKPWQEYIKSDNPVAAALLSKMGYRKEEKVKVKLEYLRMLTRMELDPARMVLLTGFFETYLKLNKEEEKTLEESIGKLSPKEAEKMLEITTSWHEKGRIEGRREGRQEGRQEGQAELVLRLISKKIGFLSGEITEKVRSLDIDSLNDLGEAVLDFTSMNELEKWLKT